jgi:hypothetical protein
MSSDIPGTPQEPIWPNAPLESTDDVPRLVDSGSLTRAEIQSRFGFHKATIEGPNPSRQRHADLREAFQNWAGFLSLNTTKGRETALMFTALEEASMWAHKAIAATDEIDPEV